MIDFKSMNGYEFEQLICKLMKAMGFFVEQTSLSNDGGIDIIAEHQEPIFKGKYLIQCKNWSGVVGQPEVRDLYGVVISEGANKGILITTSHFTKQAQDFANNKNIELVDGRTVLSLLSEYNISQETIKINQYEDLDGFDMKKYEYLKNKIQSDRSELENYQNLQRFYFQILVDKKHHILCAGILEEFIALNNEVLERFAKKSNRGIAESNGLKYINAFLYLYKGDLFEAVEIMHEIGMLRRWESSRVNYFPWLEESISGHKNLVLLKDLMIILKTLGDDKGVDILYKGLLKGITYKHSQPSVSKAFDEIHASALNRIKDYIILPKDYTEVHIDLLNQIKDGSYTLIHIPYGFDVYKDKDCGKYDFIISYYEGLYMNISDIANNFNRETVDFDKIHMLLTI